MQIKTVFAKLFRPAPEKAAAADLYDEVVRQARTSAFYDDFGVPDTPEGRFEMIALHAALVMRRIKAAGEDGARLAQAFADAMFRDLDGALREMGVGDLSVPKKIRKLASAFYDRLQSIDDALEAQDGAAAVERILTENLIENPEKARRLADYVKRQDAHLSARPLSRFRNGVAGFMPPETSNSAPAA